MSRRHHEVGSAGDEPCARLVGEEQRGLHDLRLVGDEATFGRGVTRALGRFDR